MSSTQFLKWLLIIFTALWIIWFFTGGPQRQTSQRGIFILPISSPENTVWTAYDRKSSSGETDNTEQVKTNVETIQELAGKSLYSDKITLRSGNASVDQVDREYLMLEASQNNTNRINITGWTLESAVSGKSITIGEGAYLPFTGTVNTQEPIFLSPGSRVYITTGRSPIGTSFRTNICTGYLEQFQDFSPSLRTNCPRPEDESDFIISGPNALNDQCIDFVERIPRCQINTKQIPIDMQYECSLYITSKINYNTCVTNHKNEPGFYDLEWRVFLNRDEELWKSKRETIKLLDNNNNLVDTITY